MLASLLKNTRYAQRSFSGEVAGKSETYISDMRNLTKKFIGGSKAVPFEGNPTDKAKLTEFHVHRYNPEEARGYVQSYWLDTNTIGPMVLDALIKIKNEMDQTLTFRRSCREGICGSCAMHINGVNTLACLAPITPKERMVVGPLVRLPLIKDLVVDLSNFYNQYKNIEPFLKRKTPKAPDQKEYYQSVEDRKKLDGLYECVLCACCSTLCPSYWWNQFSYPGPAVLMQAYRWVIDSRDEATDERLEKLIGEYDVDKCYQIGTCTITCPKGLNPRDALKGLKELVEDYRHRKVTWDA